METKNLDFKIHEVRKDKTGTLGLFKGHASVFDAVDSYNEAVAKGAFSKTLKENQCLFPLCWMHDITKPLGMAVAEENEKGLIVIGEMNLDVQLAREKYSLMKQRAITGLSIGFKTLQEEWDNDLRTLKEIKLYEISPITRNFQACPGAEIEAVKHAPDDLFEAFRSLNEALRRFEKSLGGFK